MHLYGHPANLEGIQRLCAEWGVWLLEDCAQAPGAAWQGRKVGTFGRAGVFSFYPSENLTVMSDGGLLVTDDDESRRAAGGFATTGASARTCTPRWASICGSTTSRPVARYRPSPLPHTEHIVDEILTLPISAGHTEDEIGEVCAAIHAFFEERVAGGKPS